MKLTIRMKIQDFSLLNLWSKSIFNNNSGQSVIEFLLTATLVFGFIFIFLNIGINFTNGYLVHYATFMASRTYLVSDSNSNQPEGGDTTAEKEAIAVFKKYKIDYFMPSSEYKINFNTPEGSNNLVYTGLYVEFIQKLSNVPGMFGGSDPIQMVSESFLGRESTRAYTLDRICTAMRLIAPGVGSDCDFNTTLFDNGG